MYGVYLYGAIIAMILLYINTTTIMKKIKRDEDIILNNILGSIAIFTFFICIYSIF